MLSEQERVQRLTYRVVEVAAMLGVGPSTVRDLVRRRVLDAVHIGDGRRTLVLIPASAVEELLTRYRVPARAWNGAR